MSEDFDTKMADLLKRAGPNKEAIELAVQSLKTLPMRPLDSSLRDDMAKVLNMLRAIDTDDVLAAIIAIEFKIDDTHSQFHPIVIGEPRRIASMKILLDQIYFDELTKLFARMAARRRP